MAIVLLSAGVAACASAPAPQPLTPEPTLRRPLTMRLPQPRSRQPFRLQALRGHPVLLFVFTTWSLRAQAETARIKHVDATYAPRGLRTVAIALDRRGEDLVRTYVDFIGFRFPVIVADPEDLELVGALGITRQVPRTLLLDHAGILVQDHATGMTDFPKLQAGIERLLLTTPARKGAATRLDRAGSKGH